MDTCVIPLRHGGLSLVQTTDYIYPIVDDPYMMVRCLKMFAAFCQIRTLGIEERPLISPGFGLILLRFVWNYQTFKKFLFFFFQLESDLGLSF